MRKARYPQDIRFADIDMMGHVNNSIYLTYFEQARMKFMIDITPQPWSWIDQGIVVARNEINYRKPIFLGDILTVEVEALELNTSSFTLLHTIIRNKEICADCKSVMVCFDYGNSTKIVIPEVWRNALSVD
jgi:acyl-CoA thioester hydrolase